MSRPDGHAIMPVRRAADAQGWSVNGWMTRVFGAATDPSLGGTEAERVRERLRLAGLLDLAAAAPERPARTRVARARKAAGQGVALSELLADDRR